MPPAPKQRKIHQYHFLVGRCVDQTTLSRAGRIAGRWGTDAHHVLIDLGWVSALAYATALADALALPLADPQSSEAARGPMPAHAQGRVRVSALVMAPDEIAALAADAHRRGVPIALTWDAAEPRGTVASAAAVAAWATHGLASEHPHMSARTVATLGQKLTLTFAFGLLAGGVAISPHDTLSALLAILTLPFVFVVVLRAMALWQLAMARKRRSHGARVPDIELPVYSVLVPLYREARMVPDLVGALSGLDYPAAKLDIIFAVEEDDARTRRALARLTLPPQFRVVIVPPGGPRTKPKALNVALAHARGAFVAIYDAEDHPEPDQLRRALQVYHSRADTIGCVQARLGIDNAASSWLTRQFAIEYAALFDAILPLLERLGLPVPLGGTSNHFPRRLLEHVGGWDPYNVTEDADLGIRLARHGWGVAIIESTTWEEAPRGWRAWLRQRTRWQKGWMQTVLVHMRNPWRLMRDLGEPQFLGFQALMGGLILAALVHPWFYALLAWEVWHGRFLAMPETLLGQSFWGLAALNLGAGYLVSMLLGLLAALRRGRLRLGLHVVLLPLYWLAISLAAHRALWHLLTDPHGWEKTPHTPRARRLETHRRR